MSIFTAARKITAARIAGACTAAGVISYLTKETTVVGSVAGLVVTGALLAHRKLAKADIEEVSPAGLAAAAGISAAEVTAGSAAAIVGKRYLNGRNSAAATAPDASEVVTDTIPAEAIDIVTA